MKCISISDMKSPYRNVVISVHLLKGDVILLSVYSSKRLSTPLLL